MENINYERYKIFDFDGKLKQLFNSRKKLTNNELVEYLNENIDNLASLICSINSDNIEKNNLKIMKICILLDSINYNNNNLISKIVSLDKDNFIYIIKNIIESKIEVIESKNLVNLISYYYDALEENINEEGNYEEIAEMFNSNTYDPLKIYLNEIANNKVLTQDETNELFRKYKEENSQEAKDTLIKCNLKLIINIAKRYIHFLKHLDFMDIIMEGNAGLIKAIENYDYTLGYKFSTYACWWITRSIKVEMMKNNDAIRIPIHVQEKAKAIAKKIKEFEFLYGKEPTDNELINFAKIKTNELENYKLYISIKQESTSLNEKISQEDDSEIGDFIQSNTNTNDEAEKLLAKDEIKKLIKKANLSEKEIEIIYLRYGLIDGRIWRLDKIGKKYNVSRERIRQVEENALKKLSLAANVQPKKKEEVKSQATHEDALYTYYKRKYSQKELENAISRLNSNSKRILKVKYGIEYNECNRSIRLTRKDKNELNKILTSKLPRALNNKKYVEDEDSITLYEYFNIYSKNEILDVIDKFITKEDLNILRKVYGNTLNEVASYEKIKHDYINFNRILVEMQNRLMYIRKIKVEGKYEEQFTKRNLYEELSEYTKEQVDDAVSKLPKVKYKQLMEIYNNDINNKIVIIGSVKGQVIKFANVKTKLIEIINNPNKQYRK